MAWLWKIRRKTAAAKSIRRDTNSKKFALRSRKFEFAFVELEQSLKVLGFGSFWVPRSRVYVEYMRPRQMPVLRSWRFWGALVALIITWRVTIKAEIRPLLCSAAAACVEALVCAVLPDRVEACNGVRIFPKVRKKTELTNTWTAISGIKILIPLSTLWKSNKHARVQTTGFGHAMLASLAHWRFQDWNLNLFNPYWHSEAVWCPPITRNNAVAKSNAWLSPPGNLAGQAWNYQLQMIDKTLIRRATGGGMLDDGSSNCKGNWYTKSKSIFDLSLRNPFCLTAFSKQHFVV